MKILHVSLWPIDQKSIGGTEKYVIELATSLQKRHINNDVLMLSGKRWTDQGVHFLSLKIQGIKKLDEYSIRSIFFKKVHKESLQAFAKTIEDSFDFSEYDLINFNSLLFYFCVPNMHRVFTVHTNPIEFDQNWGDGTFNLVSKIIKSDNCENTFFVAPAAYYADKYRKKFDQKVEVIPHALSDQQIKSISSARKDNASTYNFFVPSRLEPEQKGQDLLLEGLGINKKFLPNFEVIFSGVDDQYQDNVDFLTAIARKFKINVKFKKFTREDMAVAYLAADLIILPSRYESYGYAALESLAQSKKTILSNIPTFREIAAGNNFAFTVNNFRSKSFANTINKALRSSVVNCNTDWFDRYSKENWTKTYINFYKSCIKK